MSPIALEEAPRRASIDFKEYRKLLDKSLPRVIQTEAENEYYIELLKKLDQHSKELSPAQKELAELVTLLIEDFEDRHYQLKPATPIQILLELVQANGLKQKELADVFGSPSIVSEVLRGKRKLTTEHIKRLSQRFHVSPELFI